MRVVLDTNVIISSFLTPHGRVARIIDLWEQNALELIVSEVIVSEYNRVLHYRRKHRLTDTQLAEVDAAFREFTEFVVPGETPDVVKDDPDDNHFLAAADAGMVDCMVSGDPHLLKIGSYKGIPIHSPAEFLRHFFPD